LLRAAELIRADQERLSRLESIDSGKPLAEACDDIAEVAFMFEYYGGWATKLYGEIPPVGPDALSLVLKEPVGVVGAIVPWNYPLMMAAQKVAPALAAGCTVVLKPAEQTPLTALELPKILMSAGLPDSVIHVVTGFGDTAGAALVESEQVDKISFTGSRDVGRVIVRSGAQSLKRVTLELGGKSPNIVFSDADLDAAIEGSCNGIFSNQGEICSAGSRVLVDRRIYERVIAAFVERVREIRLGEGLDPSTTMGPLVSAEQKSSVERYIEIGQSEAKMVATGDRPKDPRLAGGYFVSPTIFTDVDNRSTIASEEIFGPVMCVTPFDGMEDALRLANETDYGLAAAVWTNDINKSISAAKALRAGIVWINDSQPAPSEAPWGGFKQSGIGRELGREGVEDYLETKHVYIKLKG